MFNPLNSASALFNNYVSFWESTSTGERVCSHLITLIPVIVFRSSVRASPLNISYIHEIMIMIGLISHVFVAMIKGRHATKKLDPTRVDVSMTHKLNGIDQQLKIIQQDIKELKKSSE